MSVSQPGRRRKIILCELNEVPLRVIDTYCRLRPGSALAAILHRSRCFETYAEDQTGLSPWKTWPSLHRGVPDTRHGIGDFGQDLRGQDRDVPPLWRILAGAGISVGLCGSLHTYPPPAAGPYRFCIPDALASGPACLPAHLSGFQALNLELVRASGRNVSGQVPLRAGAHLLLMQARGQLGLRLDTCARIGLHLLAERLQGWRRTRRRGYQTALLFDLFMRLLRASRPDFVTFFTNHVAAAMHRYWAATFPQDYATFGYDEAWVRRYRGEIPFAMDLFDRCLGRLLRFIEQDPDYQLWITTSMGQAATEAVPVETQLYLVAPERLLGALGLGPGEWERRPAMLPQYNFVVASHKREALRRALAQVVVAGAPLCYREGEGGFFSLDLGHQNLLGDLGLVHLGGRAVPLRDLGLARIPIEDQAGTSAYHVPQGALLVFPGQPRSGRLQISTLDLAPALLRHFAVAVPPYMRDGTALRADLDR